MNITPIIDTLIGDLYAFQDYINEKTGELLNDGEYMSPEDFTSTVQDHFCNFLDNSHSVEIVLAAAVEKVSKSYEEEYRKKLKLAKVYDIREAKKSRKSSDSGDILDYVFGETKGKDTNT